MLAAGCTALVVLLTFSGTVMEQVMRTRKETEEAARQWQRAVEQAEISMALVNPHSDTFQAVNDAFARQHGYRAEELIGAKVSSLYPAEMRDRLLEEIRGVDMIKRHAVFEAVHRRKDGSQFPVLVDVTAVRDDPGRLVSRVAYVLDLTERKVSDQELEAQRERLAVAQQAAHFGSFDWDLASNAFLWSEEMQRLYGFGPGEFGGRLENWAECLLPEERERQIGNAGEAARTGVVYHQFRIRRHDTGELRWMEARGQVFCDGQGQPIRMVGINVDITDRKTAEGEVQRLNAQLEQRVRERTAQLEAANQELEAFSYSVSHDLRAPLRGIDGWSLALLEDYGGQLDDRARQYLDRVRSETQRMGMLIDDLLQLSRVTRAQMRLEPVDLSAMAQEIAGRMRETETGRQIEFVIHSDLKTEGDARLLGIVLTNLLDNAVKFTGRRERARIEFGKSEIEGRRAFYVRDNGAGFDMQYAGTLFGAFQRLHRPSEFPGTGIGLATVQRVIRRHNGRVWAEGKVDEGATFYFTVEVAA